VKVVETNNLHISLPTFICTYHHITIQHRITATTEIYNPSPVSSRSLLLWKAAWLELVTDSAGQNISHQLPTQAMKHTRRANTSTTLHHKSELLRHDKNSTFMARFVSSELKSLKFSHTYNHLYLHQKCYYRSRCLHLTGVLLRSEGSKLLQNNGVYITMYMASYSRSWKSSSERVINKTYPKQRR
jgi:hypothetical protein